MPDLLGASSKEETKKQIDKKEVKFKWGGVLYKETTDNYIAPTVSLLCLKDALNEVAGKFGYWAAVHASVIDEQERLEQKYEFWYAGEYTKVSKEMIKSTEGAKKYEVMIRNPDYFRDYYEKLHELKHARRMTKTIVDSYAMKSENLRSVHSTARKEWEEITRRG